MFKKRLLLLPGLMAAALLAVAACGGPPGSDALSNDRSVLRRGNGGVPGSLDPALAEDIHAFNILADLYEGLLAEAADGSLIPGVAESWTVSDDGLVYTFALRPDARWSNGDPVVAADFVRAFRHVASPQTAAPLSFLLQPVRNFSGIVTGEKAPAELGITAVSDDTLRIDLAAPSNHWLSVLALPIAVPRHAAANDDVDDTIISNGAFSLLRRAVNGPVHLQRNEHFWNSNSVALDEVIYFPVVDPLAEFNMYRAGELEITHVIPSDLIGTATDDFGSEARIAPSLALYYLAFDLTEPPFDKPLLRQALTMAIDRQQLVTIIGRGEQPAFGVVPPGVASYERAQYSWANLSREQRELEARRLYLEAGYSTEKPLAIQLLYDAGGVHEKIALTVESMWRDVLGVETTLDKREWQYFLDTRSQRAEWDVMRFSWFGDYNAAMTFLEIFKSDSPQNLAGYQNANYDGLLAGAARQTDLRESAAIMQLAESALINDYPVAPLYFYVSKHMVKPQVAGFEDNVMDRHPSRFLMLISD
ncbi:MAG: peptide ABC transporter substrate-binding protein [Woeseia sp.]